MSNFCESHLEQAALEWFEELGYNIIFAPDGEYSEREDYSDVIFKERLQEALARINPTLPQDALEDAFRQILIPQNPSLIMNNKVTRSERKIWLCKIYERCTSKCFIHRFYRNPY